MIGVVLFNKTKKRIEAEKKICFNGTNLINIYMKILFPSK